MRKTLLYSFLPCIVAMLMCSTFTACSDDDDDDSTTNLPIKESSIIGKWVREDITLNFFDDGTAFITEEEYKTDYTYWISENRLYLKDTQYPITNIYDIVSITNSQLILRHIYYKDGEEIADKEKIYKKE